MLNRDAECWKPEAECWKLEAGSGKREAYSYRNASIGSSRDALMAGKRPKKMPMVAEKWPQVTRWEVDLAGPDQAHHAVGHIYVDSMEAFGEAMASPGTGDVMSDIVNYTNTQPVMYVGEVAASS